MIYARNGISEADFWHDGAWVAPCSKEFHDWSFGRMIRAADSFTKAGTTLVLVTSLPSETVFTPSRTAAYRRAVSCGNRVLHDVAAARPGTVKLVDLFSHFCDPKGECTNERLSHEEVRPDGTHFRREGARVTARWILSRIGIKAALPG